MRGGTWINCSFGHVGCTGAIKEPQRSSNRSLLNCRSCFFANKWLQSFGLMVRFANIDFMPLAANNSNVTCFVRMF